MRQLKQAQEIVQTRQKREREPEVLVTNGKSKRCRQRSIVTAFVGEVRRSGDQRYEELPYIAASACRMLVA